MMVAATQTTRFLPFLEPAEESAVLTKAPVKSFDRDQVVVEQNAPLRAIFLIEDGSVRVERQGRGQMIPLAILSAGEFFGEMSFVDGAPTSARIVADEPTRLRVIDEAMVDDFTKKDPSFAGRLYRSIAAILVERLRATSMHFCLDQAWGG
jgi:CRP-like cAMP-binding protein